MAKGFKIVGLSGVSVSILEDIQSEITDNCGEVAFISGDHDGNFITKSTLIAEAYEQLGFSVEEIDF